MRSFCGLRCNILKRAIARWGNRSRGPVQLWVPHLRTQLAPADEMWPRALARMFQRPPGLPGFVLFVLQLGAPPAINLWAKACPETLGRVGTCAGPCLWLASNLGIPPSLPVAWGRGFGRILSGGGGGGGGGNVVEPVSREWVGAPGFWPAPPGRGRAPPRGRPPPRPGAGGGGRGRGRGGGGECTSGEPSSAEWDCRPGFWAGARCSVLVCAIEKGTAHCPLRHVNFARKNSPAGGG